MTDDELMEQCIQFPDQQTIMLLLFVSMATPVQTHTLKKNWEPISILVRFWLKKTTVMEPRLSFANRRPRLVQ